MLIGAFFWLKDIHYLGYVITREGIKPDPKKVEGIMNPGKPSTTTEARALIGMIQYYRDICPRYSHILSPLTEAASRPKVRTVLCNDAIESVFKELKLMVSTEKLLSYPYCKQPFAVHNDASVKQLGAIIINNNEPIVFFSRIFIKPQRNYTTTEKELLAIVECLKQFHGIPFVYEINVFSYHKNIIYTTILSEYQRVMRWKFILE